MRTSGRITSAKGYKIFVTSDKGCNLSVFMCRHLGVDVYGKGSCSDPGLTCDRKSDDKCLQMLNNSYKVTP